jgi:hypothetical protein
MKPSCLYSLYGEPIAFKLQGLYFISLEDVKKFCQINKMFSFEDVQVVYCSSIHPELINLKKSLEENSIVYYTLDELELSPNLNFEL